MNGRERRNEECVCVNWLIVFFFPLPAYSAVQRLASKSKLHTSSRCMPAHTTIFASSMTAAWCARGCGKSPVATLISFQTLSVRSNLEVASAVHPINTTRVSANRAADKGVASSPGGWFVPGQAPRARLQRGGRVCSATHHWLPQVVEISALIRFSIALQVPTVIPAEQYHLAVALHRTVAHPWVWFHAGRVYFTPSFGGGGRGGGIQRVRPSVVDPRCTPTASVIEEVTVRHDHLAANHNRAVAVPPPRECCATTSVRIVVVLF